MKASTEISVSTFRQKLIWPLFLHKVENGGKKSLPRSFLPDVTEQLEKNQWSWKGRSSDTLNLLEFSGYKGQDDYSEIIYFHSFVRDFLYGGDGTKPEERALRIFRRDDVKTLEATVKGRDYVLEVDPCELYLFESGVLILVMELNLQSRKESQFSLAEILDLQNALRMAFPRRWDEDGNPKECPSKVRLIGPDADSKELEQDFNITEDNPAIKDEDKKETAFTKIVRERAELPAVKHLRFLLRPLGLYGTASDGYCYQQVEDQRIPSMTYVAVENPREIFDGDYARLTFFDDSGESTVGPYSDDFLKDWEKRHTYDRFWQRTESPGSSEAVRQHNDSMCTRWLCSGYGFVAVGVSGDRRFGGQTLANFRHHYFRMGLIAHFHRASILVLRDLLSEAMKQKDRDRDDAIINVQAAMVRFRSRYWFSEVSTQLQGQELFSWWSDLLGNQKTFEQVNGDIDAAASLVRIEQQKDENRNVTKLTKLAAFVAAVTMGLAFLTLMAAALAWPFLHVGEGPSRFNWEAAPDAFFKIVAAIVVAAATSAMLGALLWKALMYKFFPDNKEGR